MTTTKTRTEHLQWVKDRAKEEYTFYEKDGHDEAVKNAGASLLSDLGKHPETRDLVIAVGQIYFAKIMLDEFRTKADVFRFIEGVIE